MIEGQGEAMETLQSQKKDERKKGAAASAWQPPRAGVQADLGLRAGAGLVRGTSAAPTGLSAVMQRTFGNLPLLNKGRGVAGLLTGLGASMRNPGVLFLMGCLAATGIYGLTKLIPDAKKHQAFPSLFSSSSPATKELAGEENFPREEDSLDMLAKVNEGALGEADEAAVSDGAADDEPDAEDAVQAAVEAVQAQQHKKADAQALMARLADSMKGDMSSRKGGGASSGASYKIPSAASAIASGKTGRSRAMKSARSMKLGKSGTRRASNAVSSALGQLQKASDLSQYASGQTGESSAYTAAEAFEGDSVGDDASEISGEGVSTDDGGLEGGDAYDEPSNTGSDDDKSVTGESGEEEEEEDEENVTPYQDLIDYAQYLIMAASALLLIAWLMGKSQALKAYAQYASGLAMLCAGAATAIGIFIMLEDEQMDQGLLLTMAGAFLTYLAYNAWTDDRAATAEKNTQVNGQEQFDKTQEKLTGNTTEGTTDTTNDVGFTDPSEPISTGSEAASSDPSATLENGMCTEDGYVSASEEVPNLFETTPTSTATESNTGTWAGLDKQYQSAPQDPVV